MARRKKTGQRVTNVNATPVLSHPTNPFTNLFLRPLVRVSPLQLVEDRRTWHPSKPLTVTAATTRSGAARLRVSARRTTPTTAHRLTHSVAFARPARVPICTRRLNRRKAMFALQRTGKGARSRIRKRTEHSSISCRG